MAIKNPLDKGLIYVWCPGTDSNRHGISTGGF